MFTSSGFDFVLDLIVIILAFTYLVSFFNKEKNKKFNIICLITSSINLIILCYSGIVQKDFNSFSISVIIFWCVSVIAAIYRLLKKPKKPNWWDFGIK